MTGQARFIDADKKADTRLANKIKRQKLVAKRKRASDLATVTNRYKGQASISDAGTHKKLTEW